MSNGKKIAETIVFQLGGFGKLVAMINARDFVYGEDNLTFKFSGSRKTNCVNIKLNGLDHYDITFFRIGKIEVKTIQKFNDVYNNMLKSIIEEFTGLRLSL